ncbi:mechanosensitive ion channel domain-containing protein [Ponticaulis sp.]|uniref:mechanosensitive ion channel family protein n=1 Tax=Ponticaulis sp. TaxID=2020902 RepID=UPI000C4D7360|nr:mechanosensitive ion channel domain-containing protein [Ponticaulis sp.]MAJ10018.1 mechanosensitive ion channel protein MscS [Ponticaulis sp.]HBH88830.1 mechanosensitive ion channel protein MscS [Hyphomonadaceae bacterium]HBJ93512.1 mechanosensitive ion channel protein MscS [Hyphomonadaceae bacterium]|tara:strand:+ start:2979 stop:3806 length:828 start_codon:yes stop_codon:yes gene_type:complete
MEFDPQAIWDQYGVLIVNGALNVIGAIILLIIGLRIAGWLASVVRTQAEKRENVDNTLANFFASIVRWGVTAAVVIAVFGIFGIPVASFAAVLGALTLAIGLSMQGALGNIASGVMIMLFRPYKLGDFIEVSGVSGSVKDINLFQTVIATPDNKKIMIPNGQAIDGVITNYSGYTTRRCDVVFGIDYDDDFDNAIAILKEIIAADERIMKDPEPFVRVTNLGDSSVDITCRLWCQASDYWAIKFDLLEKVKKSFDKQGVSIPYPHTTIVKKDAAA